MLWYKGWLETRFKVLFALCLIGLALVSLHSIGGNASAPVKGVVGMTAIFVVTFSAFLAGAGIATQPALQATKGLHGSMLFTLSLPVSRLQLLAVRACLGWIEMAAGIAAMCGGMWFLFPPLRGMSMAAE